MGGKKGGKGSKMRGETVQRDLQFASPESGEVYGVCKKFLGDGRLMAICYDGKERLCEIRGALRRSPYIRPGDVLLICRRTFADDDYKADVLLRYQPDEVKQLKKQGQITDPDLLLESNENPFKESGAGDVFHEDHEEEMMSEEEFNSEDFDDL